MGSSEWKSNPAQELAALNRRIRMLEQQGERLEETLAAVLDALTQQPDNAKRTAQLKKIRSGVKAPLPPREAAPGPDRGPPCPSCTLPVGDPGASRCMWCGFILDVVKSK
ncbi:MAG: hypothetical protein GMKNLPBB_01473 [Myxococcota bacterium]|nr:hypothetical protein [Myxococcota bacterium]